MVYFDNLFARCARLRFWGVILGFLNGDGFIVQLVYSCSLAWAFVPVTGGLAGAERLGRVIRIISVSSRLVSISYR